MKTNFFLSCPIRRPGGVEVLVPLLPGAQTLFLDPGELRPANSCCLSVVASDDADRGQLSLEEVVLTLWPAGFAETHAALAETVNVDNRLDMESRLQEWADLVAALLGYWQRLNMRFRSRFVTLPDMAPRWARLLTVPIPAGAVEVGLHQGQPLRQRWVHLFPESPAPPSPDEEAWEAWKARDSADILGDHGGLSQFMQDRFELRDGQLEMAKRIEESLENHEYFAVEAGTGIGKSLAYLVPALLHGSRHKERTIISTYTKALQSQLVNGDLPLLEHFGYPGYVRLLLGRNNYLCARQLRRALAQTPMDREEALAQLALGLWTCQSPEGRRAELADHPWFARWWVPFFESVEPCSPHICHRDPPCFVVRARRLAREAPVVVVNHSLLMMDLKSAQGLLGPSNLLVVDEAHELPAVATGALSHWIRRSRLDVYRNLVGDKPPGGGLREVPDHLLKTAGEREGADRVKEACLELDAALDAHLNAYSAWYSAVESSCEARLGEGITRSARHRYHDGAEAFGDTRGEAERLFEGGDRFESALAQLLDATASLSELNAQAEEERESLASLLQFHRDLLDGIQFCLKAEDEDWVYWIDWAGVDGMGAIVAAPLTVEAPLAELWEEHYQSVIMTSATLAVGDEFAPFAQSVGFTQVSRRWDSLVAKSPFHYDEQALVLTTPDLIDPKDTAFPGLVAGILADIGRGVSTKILTLCTSYQLVEGIHDALQDALRGESDDLFHGATTQIEPVLLRQTPGSNRDRLAASFREAEAAILLATGSFWEGVDFPGRQLEVLVVPRLPFAVPTDPLVEGRYDRARRLGRDPFQDVALADAVLRLKQGVGRLLRSREDRGVILLLDQRLQARSYGVVFLNSMPTHCEWVPTRGELAHRVIEFLSRERAD